MCDAPSAWCWARSAIHWRYWLAEKSGGRGLGPRTDLRFGEGERPVFRNGR